MLLELHYGDKLHMFLAAKEQVREAGLSIRKVECWLDAELFLDKYPRWDIKGPHCPIILHSTFLHAAKEGQKEAERFVHQGHWHGLPRLNLEADVPAIQLVGYWTTQKEIPDLYHEVYLLRSPSPPPCGPWWREEAIQGILSSLRSHLWGWGGTTMLKEDQWGASMATQPIPNWIPIQVLGERQPMQWGPWEAREAHQQALEAACMLELNIERLSQGVETIQHQCPYSHSSSHLQSRSLDRQERSPSQHRLERHVTFLWPWGDGGPLPIWRLEMVCPKRCPWPTQAPEIECIIWQNHQLRTMRHGWIGKSTS